MIKDSGTRREFDTGGVRDMGEGKGRFDLIPWDVIWALAKHYEEGAKKYEENNWKYLPTWTFKDSGMRHLAKHLMGYDDEDHLISAIWNLVGLYHLEHKCDKIDTNNVEEFTFTIDAPVNLNSLIKSKNDGDDKKNDGLKTCDVCGKKSKTLYVSKSRNGFVCSKCWHKEGDDLK